MDVRTRNRGGFSLVEVIIAMVILAVGVLGLGGTTAYIVRQVTLADVMTERAAALQTVVEELQSIPYTTLAAGNDSVGLFAVRWTVTQETARSSWVRVITTGPGLHSTAANPFPSLGPNVPDTFSFRRIP